MIKLILILSMFTENKLQCPECIKEGCESQVFVGYTAATLLGFQPYYDKEGNYHSHDPNNNMTHYSCTEGHKFTKSHKIPCPNKDCGYGKETK